MQILAKIDRFSQFPQLNFRGYPFAATFVGVILSFIVIISLIVVFAFLVSSAVGNPTTTSVITQSYVDTLDLISNDFKFCLADLSPVEGTGITYFFEQDLANRFQVYTLSTDNTRVNRKYKYCPDKSVRPILYCICLDEDSVMISPSDTFYVKFQYPEMSGSPNYGVFLTVPIKTLIPKTVTDPFLIMTKTYRLSDLYRPFGSLGLTMDRLIYKVDDNYFVATPKTTYSVLPRTMTESVPTEQTQRIISWSLSFTGQTISTETTATKILSVLAQVGALNGVFVIVFTVLFLPFFKLKYTENLLNGINKKPVLSETDSKSNKPEAKTPDLSPEDIELIETSRKERAQTLVKKSYMSKKPLYIGFWEWLCPCYKRASKVKIMQETELALKKNADIARVIRTQMDIEIMKRVLFNPEQLHLLENIPFEYFAFGKNDKKVKDATGKAPLDLFEILRSQTSKEDVQSRFAELMRKYYD